MLCLPACFLALLASYLCLCEVFISLDDVVHKLWDVFDTLVLLCLCSHSMPSQTPHKHRLSGTSHLNQSPPYITASLLHTSAVTICCAVCCTVRMKQCLPHLQQANSKTFACPLSLHSAPFMPCTLCCTPYFPTACHPALRD